MVWERQHEGFGNVEKVAVVYYDGKLLHRHQRRRPRRRARAGRDQRRPALALLGRARPRRVRQRHLGRRHLAWNGGATPWIHPAIDPDLGTGLLDVRQRARRLVAGRLRRAAATTCSPTRSSRSTSNTGAYKWHFQSIHHDIWDMDNVMSPVLVDAKIRGRKRKLVVYGSKSGHVLHPRPRATAARRSASTKCPVPQEPRQKTWPTQPFPRQGGWTENCVVDQPLGTVGPGRPEPRGAQLRAAAACTPRTGTSRSCRSRATAAAPTGTTSRSARAPAWCTPASATSPRRTR